MAYLRVLFIMILTVVVIGTVAVVDAEESVAKNEGLWLMVFTLLVLATVVAARLFRSR
jgi:hypothetical protein